MDYNALKKLDEESMQQLQESSGPADKCICHLFTSPDEARGLGASIRRALGSIGKSKQGVGGRSVKIPFTYQKGGHGVYSTRRAVQRKGKCGKCACDSEKVILKDSDLSIRITTPDISSICPCPSDCLPEKAKLQDNIKVTIEYAETPEGTPWNTRSAKDRVMSDLEHYSINEAVEIERNRVEGVNSVSLDGEDTEPKNAENDSDETDE